MITEIWVQTSKNILTSDSNEVKKTNDAEKIMQQSIFTTAEETKPKEKSEPIPKQIDKIIKGNYPFDLDANIGKFFDGKVSTKYLETIDTKNMTDKEKEVFNAYKEFVSEYVYWQTKRNELSKKDFDKIFYGTGDSLSGQESVKLSGHAYRLSKLEDKKAKLEAAKEQVGTNKNLSDAINEKIKETNEEIAKENKR